MRTLSRWIAPGLLAAAFSGAALVSAPVRAQDNLTRVIVDIADVVFRSGTPYYRNGNYGYDDRLIVQRDRYGRPIYYRQVPYQGFRNGPPHGNAYGYYRNNNARNMKCNKHGKCKVQYYDPRYDRRDDDRYDRNRYSRYSRDGGRYWDGRRWRDRHDD